MKTRNSALIIALVITLSGVGYSYYISNSRREIKGTASVISDADIAEAENQSERIPEKKVNIDSLLISLGKEAGHSIVEIIDTSYTWKTEKNDYEILGKSVVIKNSSEEILSKIKTKLKNEGFIKSPKNNYTTDHKLHLGYSNEEAVCLLRRQDLEDEDGLIENKAAQLEVRCGVIDYERIMGNPALIDAGATTE